MNESLNYYRKLERDLTSILEKIKLLGVEDNLRISYTDPETGAKKIISKPIELLKVELSDAVYQYYTNTREGEHTGTENYLEILRNAYRPDATKSLFHKGWNVEESLFDNQGSILVHKDKFYKKQALSGAYLSDVYPLEKGMDVSVRWQLTSFNDIVVGRETNAYYEVSGFHIPNDYLMTESLIRFYFNLNSLSEDFANQYASLFKLLGTELDSRFVPFQLKGLFQSQRLRRADSVVLYLEKRHFFATIDLVLYVSKKFEDILYDETPLFTYKIAPGIGFAEQPPFDKTDLLDFTEIPSFGQHRATLLTYRLIDFFLETKTNPGDARELIDFIKNRPSSAGDIIFESGDDKVSAFFLNRKSKDYPYVRSYFNLDLDSHLVPLPPGSCSGVERQIITVASKICSEAIWDSENRCSWLGYDNRLCRNADNSLIDGLAGIITFLFLAETNVNGGKGVGSLSLHLRGAVRCMKYRLLDKIIWAPKNGEYIADKTRLTHGFYKGDLMAICVIYQFDLDKEECFELKPKKILRRLRPADPRTESLYVYDGLAGSILSMIAIANAKPEYKDVFLASALNIAQEINKYIQNPANNAFEFMQLGFVSGASGIAYALIKIAEVWNARTLENAVNFDEVVESLIYYEKNLRTPIGWNFPDGSIRSHLWTNGMYSMGLSLLLLQKYFPTVKYFNEGLKTIASVISQDSSINDEAKIYNNNDSVLNYGLADLRIKLAQRQFLPLDTKGFLPQISESLEGDYINFKSLNDTGSLAHGIQKGYAGAGLLMLQIGNPNKAISILDLFGFYQA